MAISVRSILLPLLRQLAVLALAVLMQPRSFADETGISQVLILNTYDSYSAPYDHVTATLTAALEKRLNRPVAFSEMDLDARWGDTGSRESLIATLLENRAIQENLDLVVAVGPPAIRFWLQYRDTISTAVPMIAIARDGLFEADMFRPSDVGIWTEFGFSQVIEDILVARPSTRHVVMVFGNSEAERLLATQARTELSGYAGGITFEFTNDLSLGAVQTRLDEIPEEAAVFYGIFNNDVAGAVLRSESALIAIRSVSRAPIFGIFDYQLGNGIVGGRLIQTKLAGQLAGAAAASLLRKQAVAQPWQVIPLSEPVYDWRELQRWGIESTSLPGQSTIRFRPPSMWDQYAGWVVGAIAVVVSQSLLLIAVFTQRRRRRGAERAQATLSGKLITAHEDERRHIARELHDDLTQRLARLAIDVALANNDVRGEAASAPLRSVRSDLKQISHDVHDMCYRLHPALLEDLGLATALSAECKRVRRETEANLVESVDTPPNQLPRDVALCVYRIAQEALKNAVKYAEADNIELRVTYDGKRLILSVADDGRGFVVKDHMSEMGLGLQSMKERVKLVSGHLVIYSRINSGTRVTATVPLDGASI